jgi:hypothetical protein
VLAKDFEVACRGAVDIDAVDVNCEDVVVEVDVWGVAKLECKTVGKVNCKSVAKVDCEDAVELVCWGAINVSPEGAIELVCETIVKLGYKSTVEIDCCGAVPVSLQKFANITMASWFKIVQVPLLSKTILAVLLVVLTVLLETYSEIKKQYKKYLLQHFRIEMWEKKHSVIRIYILWKKIK